MKKCIGIFYLLLLIAISLIIFFIFPVPTDRYIIQKNLKDAIRENKDEILISELTVFDWETVCNFGAYDEPWQERGRVGKFPIQEGVTVPYLVQDGEWGLAFVHKGKVTKAFEVRIGYWVREKDFCVDKESAIFKRTEDKDGLTYSFQNLNRK